jgi:hypothetical protein
VSKQGIHQSPPWSQEVGLTGIFLTHVSAADPAGRELCSQPFPRYQTEEEEEKKEEEEDEEGKG